jgi:hypothetical protein
MKTVLVFALSVFGLVLLSAGCTQKYVLGGQTPVGLHCTYKFTRDVDASATGVMQRTETDTEDVRGVAIDSPDKSRQLRLLLVTGIKVDIHKWIQDGKEVDEETRKNAEEAPGKVDMDCYWVGPGGSDVERWKDMLPLSSRGYELAELRALPLEPKAVGERWKIEAKGGNYSIEGYAELAKVENRDGKKIATIKGACESTWTMKNPVDQSTTSWMDAIDDYVREVDLATHTTESESMTCRMESATGDDKQTMTMSSKLTLVERTQMDNEKWQPGVTEFARAAANVESPREYLGAVKTITAFAAANPNAPCGIAAQAMLQYEAPNFGKNFYDLLSFEDNATWFNTLPLKKEDMKGRVCFVEVFRADAWGAYMVMLPTEKRLYEEFGPKGLMVLGIAQDTEPATAITVAVSLKYIGIKYPVYWDLSHKLGDAFTVGGMPHAMLIDRDGTIVWEGEPAYAPLREMIAGMLGK